MDEAEGADLRGEGLEGGGDGAESVEGGLGGSARLVEGGRKGEGGLVGRKEEKEREREGKTRNKRVGDEDAFFDRVSSETCSER